MKLLQASSAALVGMALCSALYAYQRTADFGFGDDAETNVKAEFYWSRLSYNAAVGSSFAGGYGGYGGYGGIRLAPLLVPRLSQGGPPGSAGDETPYPDPDPFYRASRQPRFRRHI